MPPPLIPQAKPEPPDAEPPDTADTDEAGEKDEKGDTVETMTPESLVGLDQKRLLALFGVPESVRQEPPATIWRYDGEVCIADVYFYVDLNTQDLRVVTLSLRTEEDTPEARAACLASIKSLAEDTRD